jgi:hypothetical protein
MWGRVRRNRSASEDVNQRPYLRTSRWVHGLTEGFSMISFSRAVERRDLHNASIDFQAASAGYCAFTHLASGRVCRLPYGHVDSCRFVPPGEGASGASRDLSCNS